MLKESWDITFEKLQPMFEEYETLSETEAYL